MHKSHDRMSNCTRGAVYSMLHHLEVPKGEYIIQSGGASVLGRMLIQLAKHEGIKVYTMP